jgi:hypothetical protein
LFKAKAMLCQRHWRPGTRWLGRALFDLWALTRLLAFALLGSARPRHRDAFRTWRDIWRRRQEWHKTSVTASFASPPVPPLGALATPPAAAR